MNLEEVAVVLTLIASYDQRTLGDSDVIAWHEALLDLPFDLSRGAVVQHHATSTDRIKPAHITQLVKAAQQDAAMRRPALPGRDDDLVGMPDWFRSTVEEHKRRARAQRAQTPDNQPVTFGQAISTSFDHRRNR